MDKAISRMKLDIHRTPPHSVEAEQGLLCSMLINPAETIPEVVEKINADYLYVPAHATIFAVVVDLWKAGKGIDLITFTNYLRDKKLLDEVGGPAFVTNLFLFVPTAANVQYYLEIVRDKFLLRQIVSAGTEVVRRAYEEQDEVDALIDEVVQKFHSLEDVEVSGDGSIKEHVLAKIDRMENGKPDEDVIPTGLVDLDAKSPLKKGDMPLIMAPRKGGKTVLALTIAQNVARKGIGVLDFSLEDRTPKVVDRLIAGNTRIPIWKDHITKLKPGEIERWGEGAKKVMNLPLWVRDDAFDISKIAAIILQTKRKHPELGLVIVDYAQLIRGHTTKNTNREQEVAGVSRTLRILAMTTGLAIIVLSQINEDGKSRESRALENDATACWKIDYNEEDPKNRPLLVPWQRNGDSGLLVNVCWLGEIARFENLSHEKP